MHKYVLSASPVVREPDLYLLELLHLRLAQPAAMLSSSVRLDVYLRGKDRGVLGMAAVTLLTQEVFFFKVQTKAMVVSVVVLPLPQTLAHVTPLVDSAEVMEEGVVVEETVVAELAERVTLVRRVVGVALSTMRGQFGAGVGLVLLREQLQVRQANVAVEHAVCPTRVVPELVVVPEGSLVLGALPAPVAQHGLVAASE